MTTTMDRQTARDVRDRLTNRNIVDREYYPSSSDPARSYEVLTYADGTKSCNCPGWTRRNPPGGRTCRHVQ